MVYRRPQVLGVETTYLPARLGPFLWHEFNAAAVAADFTAFRSAGFDTIRVHLAWDAFMPTHRRVARPRLRDLETLLRRALEAGVRVIPVLFAQSFGDVVILPAYAVDRDTPRRGVRVVSDGRVEIGGPRDLYADPLMLEISVTWLDALLDAFANHPAIAAWDLGHDPATTVRPRRTAEMAAWTAEMAGRVHARHDACHLTLGAGDVLTRRGVRLAPLAEHVDRLDIAVMPQRLSFGQGWPDVADVVFLAQFAQRLAGDVDLGVTVCVPSGSVASHSTSSIRDPGVAAATAAAAYAARLGPALAEIGVVATDVWPSHRLRSRAAEVPPVDRWPSLASAGVFDENGDLTVWGAAWSTIARDKTLALTQPSPWPQDIDVESYYANLNDASKDLFTSWRRGRSDHPGIVG